ncbi:hypothetical protein [Spirosoma arcticum]
MNTTLDLKQMPFRPVATLTPDMAQTVRTDGTILLRSTQPLAPHPLRMTGRLLHWASHTPDRVFMAQREKKPVGSDLRGGSGPWRTLTYAETLERVMRLARWDVSPERPIAILSENSLEHGHGLLSMAALHIGLPVSVIAPAYSLRSTDFDKLRHALNLLTPGLIFV